MSFVPCEPWLTYLKRRAWRLVAGSVGLIFAASIQAQGLPPELARLWRATKLPENSLSLVVREIDGPQLVTVNAGESRNPASVMKMVTTWSALSGLGPDYTWRTSLLAKNGFRVDDQGTLSGPLYIKAGGDPFLKLEELWSLLRELRLRGIKNLSEVVVDRSMFGQVATNPGVFDNAPDRPYNASPDAMMVNLGAVRLLFQPDARARKWIPVIDPPMRSVRIAGDIKWGSGPCPGSPAIATAITHAGQDATIHIDGTAVGSCGEFSVYRLALAQPDYFSALFKDLWRQLGGTLGKGIRPGRVPSNATPIVWHDSQTLGDVIRITNKHSNNVMARMLLLTLGAEESGPGATTLTGARAAFDILKQQHIDTRGWAIDNGAGLSRASRLTAQGLSDMLDVAWHSSLMPEFVSSLAIAGVDGTVRRRMRGDQVKGMAHLKTGTLRNARALAGYVLGDSGKRYIVVSFANGEGSGRSRAFDDALIKWLADR